MLSMTRLWRAVSDSQPRSCASSRSGVGVPWQWG